MRRLAASAILLLLLSVPAPPVLADGPALVWASDRVVNSTIFVGQNDTLEISAGVNIRFEPGPGGANDTRPMLAVMGALRISGTAEKRVSFSANETMWWNEGEPDCLNVFNDGRRESLSVRNASFSDIVLNIYHSGGEFQDCLFDRCDLNLAFSNVSVVNCTFIFSTVGSGELGGNRAGPPGATLRGCRFDGRDPASHPPGLPYLPGGFGPGERYLRAAVETREAIALENCQITGYEGGISAGLNASSIRNCTVRDCGQGIVLEGSSLEDGAELQNCTVQNCTGFGIFALGALRLSDGVIGDCGASGVCIYGALLMANCTVFNCTTGVSLNTGGSAAGPDWLLSGNRIFGCEGYAVQAEGQAVDISGNRFEDGNMTNGFGRLLVSSRVRLAVVDPAGRALSGTSELSWTDALGVTGSRTLFPEDSVLFNEYFIDNNGSRGDLFPYALRVRRGAVENRTALPAGVDRLTMVLPVLPDLVPVYLEPDSDSIGPGQEVRFLVRVQNLGGGLAGDSTVVFLVDGRVVDRQTLSTLGIRGRASVYSDPWRASPGRHTVEARLDDRGLVPEANETNNNLTTGFSVSEGEAQPFSLSGRGGYYLLVGSMALVVVVLLAGVAWARRRRIREGDGPRPK